MARKIIVPEEELHNIADAINNRADYLDSMTEGTPNKDSLVEDSTTRKMATKDMADNILKLSVNLTDYYTKEEIDEMFVQNKVDLVFGNILPSRGKEGTFYFMNTLDNDVLDLRVFIWNDNQFVRVSGTTVNLGDYASKYELNSKLIPNYTDTPGDIVFNRYGDIDENTIIHMRGANGISLEKVNDVLQISLDISTLRVDTAPEGDSSTLVANTEFVARAIADVVGGDGFVKYVIVSGEEPASRAQDTLYVYPETKQFFLGDYEISGAIYWDELPYEPEPIWIRYKGELLNYELDPPVPYWTDLSAIVDDDDYHQPSEIPKYEEIFSVKTWNDEPGVIWWLVYVGTNEWASVGVFPYDTPVEPGKYVYDFELEEWIDIDKTPAAICEYLGITDYGTEQNPKLVYEPYYADSSTKYTPFFGWDANGGSYIVTAYNVNKIDPAPTNNWDDTRDLLNNSDELGTTLSSIVNSLPAPTIGRPGYTFVGWSNSSGYDPSEVRPADITDIHDILYNFQTDKLDWRWTCGMYAVWQENEYETTAQLFSNYINDYPNEVIPGSASKWRVAVTVSGEDPYDDYVASVIDLSSYKQPDIQVYSENYPMTRDGYIAYMSDTIDSIIDLDQDPPTIVDDSKVLSGTLPNADIFGVVVYGRYGESPDYDYNEVGRFIFKPWASSGTNVECEYNIYVEGDAPTPSE